MAINAPKLVSIKEAREKLPQGFKVENVDLSKVELLKNDDQSYFINGHMSGKEHVKFVCSKAGLAATTAMRMSPALRSSAFKELASGTVRLLLDGKVIHILGDDGDYIPYPKLFDTLTSSIKATEVEVTPGRSFYMNFVTKNQSVAKPGDVVRSGISFESSYDGGIQTFSLGPFCYRLVCSNGMIGREFRRVEITSSKEEEVLELLHQHASVYQAMAQDDLIPHFINLQKEKVLDPVSWMHGYLSDVSIGIKSRNHLLNLAQSIESPTAWDLVNMVTNYANTLKPSHRRKLQLLGGHMVNEESSECRCPQCHRNLNEHQNPVIA